MAPSLGMGMGIDKQAYINRDINVITPNENTVWTQDQTYTIVWVPGAETGNITIKLYKAGSAVVTIANSTANDGSYNYQVAADQTVGTDYQVRVYKDSDNGDYSSFFEVEAS